MKQITREEFVQAVARIFAQDKEVDPEECADEAEEYVRMVENYEVD